MSDVAGNGERRNEMDIEAMKSELSKLTEQANALKEQCRQLQQKIVEAKAVFKVGDRVTYKNAKYVWQITGIGVGYGVEPKYIGSRLKKDGTPSVMVGEIWVPFRSTLHAV